MFQNTWYQLGRSIVNVYVRHVLRASIVLEEPLPAGPKILAANHPSTGDPAFVTALLKEQTTILIKETLFKVPLFGRSLRWSGHVPVVAGNGRAAFEEGMRLLRQGRTILIFPEGEISPPGDLHRAHTGAARLALEAGVPIVPVGISLDPQLLRLVHTRVEGKLEPGAWYFHGPYAMTVGKAMAFHGSTGNHEHVHTVTGDMMKRIASLRRVGDLRLAALQYQSTMHTARAGKVRRAAHWMTHSVAMRAVQSMLYFLIGTAGRI